MSRILIVDDEPRILLLLQSLLKANGYQVETARDGAAALDAADWPEVTEENKASFRFFKVEVELP